MSMCRQLVMASNGLLRGHSFTTLTRFWLFWTTFPMYVDIFYLIRVDKKSTFWTTYPPHLSNVGKNAPYPTKSWGGNSRAEDM